MKRSSKTSGGPKLEDPHDKELEERQADERREELQVKVEAVVWLVAALSLIYVTDFIYVVIEDHRVNRPYLYFGVAGFLTNLSIGIYLAYYLPHFKGVKTDDWETASPWAIPIATIFGILGCIGFTVGLWPVWHYLTIPLLFVIFMGTVMAAHFVP